MVWLARGCIRWSQEKFRPSCTIRCGPGTRAMAQVPQVCCSFPTSVLTNGEKLKHGCLVCTFVCSSSMFGQFMGCDCPPDPPRRLSTAEDETLLCLLPLTRGWRSVGRRGLLTEPPHSSTSTPGGAGTWGQWRRSSSHRLSSLLGESAWSS